MLVWHGRRKDFLHMYHHATTFALFLLVMNFPGAEKCGMLLNGAVHFIMVREPSACACIVGSQSATFRDVRCHPSVAD